MHAHVAPGETAASGVVTDRAHEAGHVMRAALDPFGIARSMQAVFAAWQARPASFAVPLLHYSRDLQLLLVQASLGAWGVACKPVVDAVPEDRRYNDPAWRVVPWLRFLKQLYLLQTRWTDEALRKNTDLPPREAHTLAFWIRQVQDACAPSNFFYTNPGAVDACMRSHGRSLLTGARLLAEDLCAREVRMAPRHELRIGRDLAATPGGVVYRNELIELIQYSPATPDVRKTPVVVIPPWINKYYILDLTPQQSLLGHLVNAGYTVFVVSWKNPGASLAGASFADYLMRGVHQAIEVARDICGVPSVHAVGYCVGGTALAALMAWLNAGRGGHAPVAHWTLLATLVDFSEPGPIAAFVNGESVETICAMMAQRGYLDGRQLELTFRMLRANSLIWHYVVHNYLYGETPPPSAVLQWNMDTTRVPAAMHGWYLRECYLENKLRRANALTIDGRGIDPGCIRQPLYAVGSEEDHITPWISTFATTQLVGGPVRYTLTTSGHILGIVNPPVMPPRRTYWSGETRAESAAAWRARQTAVAGSWWTDWTAWLGEHCVERVAPRAVGTAAYPCLAPAPGTYVHEL